MSTVFSKLAETRTLWFTFIGTILITVGFQIAVPIWDLVLLDLISDPNEARAAVQNMSSSQRNIHVFITATLDVAYPAVYGAFFIGSAFCFFKKFAFWLALPALVVIPTDLIEGVVQILALTDTVDWLSAKAILTPLKQQLFLVSLVITLVGWALWLVNKIRQRG